MSVIERANDSSGSIPTWWLANEGLLCHVFGIGTNTCYFNYPLLGEFEVTFDAWTGAGMQASVILGYGGTTFSANDIIYAQNYGYRGQNGTEELPNRFARIMHNRFNRVRLQVSPELVRYYVNGDLIQEASRSALASPWLHLLCYGNDSTAIRNLKISGQPVIPQDVNMVTKDSLLGWMTGVSGGTIAPPPADPVQVSDPSAPEPPKDFEYDWRSKEGVILGRRLPPSALDNHRRNPSHLHYQRPLIDGDQIQYQFWHETGSERCHVHPTIGQLAFLIDQEGLNLHWITADQGEEPAQNGLPSDNVLTDESIRRGRVSLIEKDWNQVEIGLKNGVLTISLNGTQIGQHPLERENTRLFGFYYDKNVSSAKIRDVVLRGEWPTTFSSEIATNLLAPARELTREERHGSARVIDEKFHAESVESLLTETRLMSLEERYRALANWVLPNDDHPFLRLYGTFAGSNGLPSHDVISAELTGTNRPDPSSRREYVNPELEAPVLDLIAIAKESQRLNELLALAEPQADDDAVLKRSRVVLRLLIQIAANQPDEAKQSLGQLVALLPTLTDDAPTTDRWPELIASYAGLQRAELRSDTLPLLTAVLDQYRKRIADPAWEARVVALRDRCQSLIESDTVPLVGGASPKRQWVSSRLERTEVHPWAPASRWFYRDGTAMHLAGEGDGYAYFQSPLRGSFTVEAEVTTGRWTETNLLYHGHWAGPHYSKAQIGLGTLLSKTEGPKLEPILEFEERCRLKLEVKPNKASWFINQREVHELALPDKPDPWLALMTPGNSSGHARQVRITGTPEIPEELDLSSDENLLGWSASLYGDPMNTSNNYGVQDRSHDAWKLSSQQIVGTKFDRVRNQKRQSLLRYHRPLAEDAVVSYDFFYEKGTTHVHPALGRTAFLLEPDGVKVHVLTDADSDQAGLSPDNQIAVSIPPEVSASIPLNDHEWNQLQLLLIGDQVQLKLNGVLIFAAPVASWNQRQFGLFHYANQTDVRVKNVKHRGEWPKVLPELKDQELSGVNEK